MSNEEKKSCDNCKYSYQAVGFSGNDLGQHCNSVKYSTMDSKDFDEDWGKGYCRYHEWKPSKEKGGNKNGKSKD